MIKLFLADIRSVNPEHIYEISKERADKIRRLKMPDDKKRCIAGGLLINHFLNGAKISVNEFGKPVADNGKYFNISHSGDYVLFVLSDSEIGCDIEKIHYANIERIGKKVFCDNEMQEIISASDRQTAFFDLWTRKESLLKCIGEGFHRKAKSVDVSCKVYKENEICYYLKTWHFADYTVSVCSEKNDFPIYIEFINLKNKTRQM